MNIETFLSNPELAKNVRFEISGDDLLRFFDKIKGNNVDETELTVNTEINPSRKYSPSQAILLIGVSRMSLHRMADDGKINYEINKRTGHRMYKGSELIKFRNNNPL